MIAVEEVSCGPACGGALQFLIYKNGKWTDVTAQVMPEIGDEDILAAYNRIKTGDEEPHALGDVPNTYWILPEKGRVLKLVLGDASESEGKTLLSFAWNGKQFAGQTK